MTGVRLDEVDHAAACYAIKPSWAAAWSAAGSATLSFAAPTALDDGGMPMDELCSRRFAVSDHQDQESVGWRGWLEH